MKRIFLPVILLTAILSQISAQIGNDTISGDLERAYSQLTNRYLYGGNSWAYGECRSDNSEVGGAGPSDIIPWQQAMVYDYLPDDFNSESFFRRCYTIIFFCNKVISEAPESSLSTDDQNRYIAEAKFLRALSFFNLALLYDSVPIVTELFYWPINPGTGDFENNNVIDSELSSMSEVFDLVKTDLETGIPYLPQRSSLTGDEMFRVTKGAAQAMLAKTYLYESSFAKYYPGDSRFTDMQQNWTAALDHAETVINSGEYVLMGGAGETFNTWWDGSYLFPGETPGFRYLFTSDASDCAEVVFAAHNLTSFAPSVSYGSNEITAFNSCRNILSPSGQPEMRGGWGLNMPVQDLVDAFARETGDAGDDPRFQVTIGIPGDSIFLFYGDTARWLAMNFAAPVFTKRASRKYACSPEEFWESGLILTSPMYIPVIRFADVLLMAAEAGYETGETSSALDYMNVVRSRARYSGTTNYPHDLTSVTFADIVHERRLELAMEGHRFYDLVRWNMAYDTLNNLSIETLGTTAEFEKGIDEFLPFPDVIGVPDIPDFSGAIQKSDFSYYPNPATEYINVILKTAQGQVEILDINGRVLKVEQAKAGINTIDLTMLRKGMYYIRMSSDEETMSGKLVIR